MPGDSGLVLLDKLKQARPNLPVIVMSAHTDVASTAGAFRGGAHEFLSKPFDLDEAVALAARALPQAEEPRRPLARPMSDDEFPQPWSAMRRRCARCSARSAGWRRRRCRC
jgi:DNA-binding NtrC family response regulator